MEFTEQAWKGLDLKDYSVVLPADSFANVGQLAMDILLTNLKLEKLCSVHHDAIIPMVGTDPSQNGTGLMTACQVYRCVEHKLILIQLRSALCKSKADSFIRQLVQWCFDAIGAKQLVLLSSVSAEDRADHQLQGPSLRFLTNSPLHSEQFRSMRWIELERQGSAKDDLPLRGGGFSKQLYLQSLNVKFPVVVLLAFAFEGDNRTDAALLVDYFNQWINALPRDAVLRFPDTWVNLFGNKPPTDLYS